MRFVGFIAVALALALVSSQTSAFEQQGAQAPASEAPSAAAPADQQPAPSALTGDSKAAGDSAGTEVRIPGLGKLGVLPKMDFGLELLYGANEQKSVEPEGQQPVDDLTIRGSMKHNF